MSYGQSSFWFLGRYLEDSISFNITFWVKVKGSIDTPRLRRAVELVSQRHESLRTWFSQIDGDDPTQNIMKESTFNLKEQPVKSEDEFLCIFNDMKNHVYDIENGDTIRLTLCEESVDTCYLLLGFHHILMDGMSSDILFANVQQAYRDGALPPIPLQYSTWAARQRSFVESTESSQDRLFWKTEFATIPTVLPLFPISGVSSRKILKRWHMVRASTNLGNDMTMRIKDRCRSLKVSPAYFHLAIWKTLLFRFLKVDDICIGVNDMNRTNAEDTGVIGNLMNILPVRFQSNPTQNFLHAVKEARTKVMTAIGHSKVPFSVILSDLDISRDSTYTPVFQTTFDYRETFKKSFLGQEAYSPPEGLARNSNGYDLSLGALESLDGESTIYLGAQSSIYSLADAEIIIKSYVHLLNCFTEHPATRVSRPSLFAPADIAHGLDIGTEAPLVADWPETVIHKIDEAVQAQGSSVSIKDGYGNTLTYSEMDHRVQAIAASLMKLGTVDSACIAVFQEPTVNWICSMLAIMRVGAIYVPLDYRNGISRLASVIKSCEPSVLLIDSANSDEAKNLGVDKSRVVNISLIKTSNTTQVAIAAKPETVGVILFTSGTTGVPKGIMLKHSSLKSSIEALTKTYGLGREVVLQQTAFSFDMCLDEIFVALCNGGTLFVVDNARRGDSHALMDIIRSEGVTYTRATPPEYSSWIRHGADLVHENRTWRYAFAGGDWLTDRLCQEFRSLNLPDLKLFNSYGPTEITLSAVKIEVDYHKNSSVEEKIPIGKPLPGYSIYILDSDLQPVPLGITGEIVIGGSGVSLGYLNNEVLSNEKFVANSWATHEFMTNGWTKMYRTGDKGSITSDGKVMFHGRMEGDLQIKLRGIRIELEDIESSILQASNKVLTEVVCTVRGDPEFIVAHAVFASTFSTDNESRSLFIQKLLTNLPLPSYMIPAIIIPIDTIPLTTHLKRDRAAIAALPVSHSIVAEDLVSDLDSFEAALKELWAMVLPAEICQAALFKRSSDFFRFGGSSLLMVELQSLIRKKFGVSLSLLDLFQVSALGEMAQRVRNAMESLED
nr:GLNRPS9 [Glarea lozoyensis]